MQTQTRTGQKFRTLQRGGGYRIESHKGTIVSLPPYRAFDFHQGTDVVQGKKLKRRLEDLERRAGSSSDSPEQQHPEVMPGQRSKTDDAGKKKKPAKPGPSAPKQNRSPIPPLTASFPTRDDNGGMFSRQYTRQLSTSPPPAFTYSQYPGTEPPPIHAPYPQHAPFHTLPAPYPDFHSQPLFLPPLPGTRPSLNSYDSAPVKQEGHFEDDGMISHFNMSYSSPMGAVEAPTTQSYTDPNAYVNSPEYSFQLSISHAHTLLLHLCHDFRHNYTQAIQNPKIYG